MLFFGCVCFFFQAEDGIRDLVRSRGLGDVYKRQVFDVVVGADDGVVDDPEIGLPELFIKRLLACRLVLSLIHI